MASVAQATQSRALRTTTPCPPPSGMHTRPWRSSPLTGPVFSTLPPVIPESSEESHENDIDDSAPRTRSVSSSSITSQTGSLSASGYDRSRNNSSSASALFLVHGDASTSSVSLIASTGAHGVSSSYGHSSSQGHPPRPKRTSKLSRPTSAQGDFAAPKNVVDITPKPRPRTVSYSQPPRSLPAGAAPPIYSRPTRSMSPTLEHNTVKQPPSVSRDPSSNWMSSSPFGPAETPKFSRLAMASPAVVMPLSAREYRKQKAREPMGKGKQKEPSTSSNRVTFIDNPASAFQKPNGVPVVKISPPPSEDVRRAPSSSGDHSSPDRRAPSPQVDHPPSKALPQTAMSPHPSSPIQRRPRSRPNTPPRSSPLAAHPPISPKSSAGTFYSCTSSSDEVAEDATTPTARPRPRRRRRSYPDRLSNGARLSLLEAMNRLSQESTTLQHVSVTQSNEAHRLSVASQASGHTLFYDVGDEGQVTAENGQAHVDALPRSPIATQSLEDLRLASTRTRTGIEVVDGCTRAVVLDADDEEGRKAKRNVRTVRISDTVQVSPPPMPRRRKLTKSRPGPSRTSMTVTGPPGLGIIKEGKPQLQPKTQPQPQSQHQDRLSLLPWKSKGSSLARDGMACGVATGATGERNAVSPIKATSAAAVSGVASPIENGSALIEGHAKPIAKASAKQESTPSMLSSAGPESPPFTPRKSRRYTFSFLPSPTFHRPKREKSNTAPPNVEPSKTKSIIRHAESGTDSTSTSIHTITRGSQSTLVPPYDMTAPTISGASSNATDSGQGSRSSVPMLRRLTAQEMATATSQGGWEGTLRGDYSTPSLITNGSTSTTGSSSPHTPSGIRLMGEFVPRPSGLKASYTDTSEEDSEGSPGGGGRTSRLCMHRKHASSPLARWGETSEEDERYLRPATGPTNGSRPGTASSTATDMSGSYLSFSTAPASTTSSSSTSRSASPTAPPMTVPVMMGDQVGREVVHACTMCGHQLPSPVPETPMHPMVAVPLMTIPRVAPGASEVRVPRYAKKPKSERHTSVQVLSAATVAVGGVPTPTRHELGPMLNGGAVTSKPPRTIPMPDVIMMTPPRSPSPPVSPHKMRKQRRPQTAPAGTGDMSVKFMEEVKTRRVREGSMDAFVVTAPTAKPKSKGESRFKTALKGLLRWAS